MTSASAQQIPDQQNPPPHNGVSIPGEDLQQQVAQALQPTLAKLREQMTWMVEQQFEPMRERLHDVAQQQLGPPLGETFQQQAQTVQPVLEEEEQPAASQPDTTSQKVPTQGDGRQEGRARQQEVGTAGQREVAAPEQEEPSRELAVPEGQEGALALQQWGENLETVALMVLALGEVLEGIALLLQAVAYFRERGAAPGERREVQGDEGEGEEVGEKQAEAGFEGIAEGGPSFLGKISKVASQSVSSLKDALSHVAGDGSSSQGGLALQQWGTILEHASTLVQSLGEITSEKHKGKGGLASMGKWLKVYRNAHSLVDEVKQTFGDGASSRHGRGGAGVLSKAGNLLSGITASDDKDDKEQGGESSEEKQGGVSSALKALAGGSSSKKEGGEGGGLLDALTGEDSPLQALREFSKRQQGPGGLAPKGPVGRKPPPGPMRRDRLPGAKS